MEQYALILILLFVMLFLSAVAKKVSIPYPVFLVLGGMMLWFIPGIGEIQLDPAIVFLIFLPPMLYDAAANISLPLFKRHTHTITVLALSLVFLTTAGIAIIAHAFIPNISWPLAFVLGAILSATDAVAALSITKGLHLSPKTVTILEGESLLNDASALTAYHFALATVGGATFVFWEAWYEFALLIWWGIAVWLVLGKLLRLTLRVIKDNVLVSISFTILMPFITYLVAELLHVSGIIAVVVLWMFVTVFTKDRFPEIVQKESKVIRSIITFLLDGIIFVIIWLNLRTIIYSIPLWQLRSLVGYSFLIAVWALAIRVGIVFLQARHRQKIYTRTPTIENSKRRLSRQSALVVSRSWMRWIVSLATALALPLTLANWTPFPERDTIIFISVMVVLITLIVQGIGLPYLVNHLHITQDQQR